MISFACTCGQKFEVPEQQAGDQFQCPNCMRLVDVPQLSELDMIADDGTIKMFDLQQMPSALSKKMAAFGANADLRNTLDEVLASGATPPDAAPSPNAYGPRYDPETGERVMPVSLVANPAIDRPQDIPMAKQVLAYSSAPSAERGGAANLTWWEMPWRLLTGVNLIAGFFVFLAHVAIHVMLWLPAGNILLLPFDLFLALMIMAHYCNTIEDFGANDRGRVPVMFRGVSVNEDLLRPLFNFGASAGLAFLPFLVAAFFLPPPIDGGELVLLVSLFWLGMFLFPAIIFTAVSSGAIQNLTPRRALSIIFVAPLRYLWVFATFAAATEIYLLALQRFVFSPITSLQMAQVPGSFKGVSTLVVPAGVVYGILIAAIYLMHLSAAWLGLLYRSHYGQLNWVLQRHEKMHRTDTAAQLAEMRRRGDPRVKKAKPIAPSPLIRPVQSMEPPSPSSG